MNTQNVNTAVQNLPKDGGKTPFTILMAEGVRSANNIEHEVYAFNSLNELKTFRRKFSEKMKCTYHYILSSGIKPSGEHIVVVHAEHYKKFLKVIRERNIKI